MEEMIIYGWMYWGNFIEEELEININRYYWLKLQIM